jgi:hypothetical protein
MPIRQSIVFLMIFSLLSANCTRFFILAGFKFNRKYITKNLCINKARPWMHCNGRCYCMKNVQQAAESEKKQQARDNLNRLELTFCQQDLTINVTLPAATSLTSLLNTTFYFRYTSQDIGSIFRPPRRIG